MLSIPFDIVAKVWVNNLNQLLYNLDGLILFFLFILSSSSPATFISDSHDSVLGTVLHRCEENY